MRPIQRLLAKMKLKGAGDAVALVAQPVAKVLDAALGTKITGCAGCKQRQEQLNTRFPAAS